MLMKLSFQQSDLGYSLKDVHLIGHSLGSHVAGEAGKRTFGAIGRITGWFNSKFQMLRPYVPSAGSTGTLVGLL